MNEVAHEPVYSVELDARGTLSVIRLDGDSREIPIDPSNSDYCKFLTWAANQSPPVAATFERLQKGSLYYGQESDVITYCIANGIVLLSEEHIGSNGTQRLTTDMMPTSLDHDPEKATDFANQRGRFLFYRLHKAAIDEHGAPHLCGAPLPVFVSHTLNVRLDAALTQESSEVRALSSWPVQKTFVYVDVSEFSQHPVGHQLLIINSLIEITTNDTLWNVATVPAMMARKDQEANLCIGDGYIFVFRAAWSAVYFAGYLAALIEGMIAHGLLAEFHFRMSVNTGPVYRFWDKWGPRQAQGRWNYVGRGITDGERVLTAIGKDKDDVVFLSAETRKQIMAESSRHARESLGYLQNRGRQKDKHKAFRRLYELNHTDWLGATVKRTIDEVAIAARRPS